VTTLNDREKQVLLAVICSFLSTGNPVASAQVAKTAGLQVSSATIRNTMLALERRGLLEQPHTSAGRRPTLEALRIYAQELRPVLKVPHHVELRIREAAQRGADTGDSVRAITQVLGSVTSLAGLASTPDRSALRLAHVRLLSLTENRVLALLVTEDGGVTHRPVDLEEPVDPHTLTRMENYLQQRLTGLSLSECAERVRSELRLERDRYDKLARRSLQVGKGALADESSPDGVVVEGESNLLTLGAVNPATFQALGALLREKGALVRILDSLGDAAGTQIVIGVSPDDGDERDGAASLVLAPYVQGAASGWVGVLGPVRMQYADVIPIVEAAAEAVGRALSDDR
jgi:heat-inducible transcriptional repressor